MVKFSFYQGNNANANNAMQQQQRKLPGWQKVAPNDGKMLEINQLVPFIIRLITCI